MIYISDSPKNMQEYRMLVEELASFNTLDLLSLMD